MKYDYQDLTDPNSSHVQVLELVGSGHRVLDVGCATGSLDKVLTARGNIVTGVEIDPEAAERARPHLARLLIGNLETIDLVAELGAGGFDVVVFADVLEHLTDPLRILRQAPALLAPGGSVVVSIPNVAHGSVRLALLQGRFDYSGTGLLDDTHLRFFTRSSVMELHEGAGLTPVDHRRVVHDPFGTEITLDPADFPLPLVDHLRADPEAMTYQFVIRSVPTPGVGGTAPPPANHAFRAPARRAYGWLRRRF
ncbi:MAG: class I SAM-dependent methyltransferase [Actinomycetota bacterium]|nr:class I SAM-dependent methyltransferase [Actinomycetota bacterium]